MELALYRRVSTQPNSPHIPLIIHPGGPGADVKQAVESAGELLAPMVEDFDVYGLSTRGTFDGKGYDCVELLDDVVLADTDGVAAGRFADACLARVPELIGNVGTRDTVEDLEDMRVALGLDEVRYLGWSYGATIGATWALLHPESIGAMVLDAPADPREPWSEQIAYAFAAGKRSLASVLERCDGDSSCRGDESLSDIYSRVVEAVEKGLLGRGTFTPRLLALAIEMPLYDGSHLELAEALRAADIGDESRLLDLLFRRLGQTPDRRNDGGIETQIGVRCADMSRSDIEASLKFIESESGVTGFGGAFERICAELPDAPRPLGSIVGTPAAKSVTVMVFASEGDPIIPVEVSSTLAREMGWRFRSTAALQHLTVGFDEAATREAMNLLRVSR